MSKRRKQILHLEDDEVAVVLTVDCWKHMIDTYKTLASEESDLDGRRAWLDMAQVVHHSIEQSGVSAWDEE